MKTMDFIGYFLRHGDIILTHGDIMGSAITGRRLYNK